MLTMKQKQTLKRRLERLGVKKTEIAKRANVGLSAVSNWFNSQKNYTSANLENVCKQILEERKLDNVVHNAHQNKVFPYSLTS